MSTVLDLYLQAEFPEFQPKPQPNQDEAQESIKSLRRRSAIRSKSPCHPPIGELVEQEIISFKPTLSTPPSAHSIRPEIPIPINYSQSSIHASPSTTRPYSVEGRRNSSPSLYSAPSIYSQPSEYYIEPISSRPAAFSRNSYEILAPLYDDYFRDTEPEDYVIVQHISNPTSTSTSSKSSKPFSSTSTTTLSQKPTKPLPIITTSPRYSSYPPTSYLSPKLIPDLSPSHCEDIGIFRGNHSSNFIPIRSQTSNLLTNTKTPDSPLPVPKFCVPLPLLFQCIP